MNVVPTLKDKSDWFPWSRELKSAFDHINQDYWLYLSGEKIEPSAPTYRSCDESQVRLVLAQRFRVPSELVTRSHLDWHISEIERYNRRLRNEYDEKLAKWNQDNERILALLRPTLSDGAQSVIDFFSTIRDAYLGLLAGYGTSWGNACLLYSEWTNLRFSSGMRAQPFLNKFQALLSEVDMVLDDDDEVPVYIQFFAFMKAVCFHPNVEHFLASLPFEGYDSEIMDAIYSHFLRCAPY